jgi:cytoskeletal protein RodZ
MDLDDAELEAQLRETLHRAAAPVHGEGVFKEAIRNEVARRQTARQRTRWTGRLALAAAVVAAAAVSLFVLIRPDQDRVDIDNSVVTQPTLPSTTAAPDPSTTETPSTSPSTTPSTTPALPEFPPQFTGIAHRQPAWGLYLAVVPPGQYEAPELAAASAAAENAGYGPIGGGDINCDEGAYETLGKEQNSVAAAVYFETEAQANQAKAAFEARGTQVVGVAHVLTGCMD